MKEIVSVGFYIPSDEDDFLDLSSNGSLSDADIAVFKFDYSDISQYKRDSFTPTFQGKPLYCVNSSVKILENLSHWHGELKTFLTAGKVVYILLSKKEEFYIHTGQKKFSDTGKNQKTTNLVEICDNFKILSPTQISVKNATGSKIFPYSPLVQNLESACQSHFRFEAYIETNERTTILFGTKNKDKVLGAYMQYLNGYIVYLPNIEYPASFYTQNENFTKSAKTWGKRFKEAIADLAKNLKTSTAKTPIPQWTSSPNYLLANSSSLRNDILRKHNEIKALQNQIDSIQEKIDEEESLKSLLFETGKPLELAVNKALTLIGYHAENFDNGILELDQVILSPEGDRFIGECEGKDSKDIDISKFRQLSDALNEDFAREEVNEKAFGILFGNPQRLIDPEKRTLTFTQKCILGAKREKIALILTSELFKVARYVREKGDEKFKALCREAIKRDLGQLVTFPAIPIQ